MIDRHLTTASRALRARRAAIQRVPDLLPAHPEESDAVKFLLTAVDGGETSGEEECGMLWKAGRDDLATAIFIGGTWAITAFHAVIDGPGADYHVTVPAEVPSDLQPATSFHVMETFQAPNGADLALLHLANGLGPAVNPPVIATAAEVQTATTVQICGFGSNDCNNPAGRGKRRISRPLALRPDPDPNQVRADNGAVNPVTCRSDSGGGAYIALAGQLKLAGIVSETVTQPGVSAFTLCVRIAPFLPWIKQMTNLPL